MDSKPPLIVSATLVLPESLVAGGLPTPGSRNAGSPIARREKQAQIEAVLSAERALGRQPRQLTQADSAYDVLSTDPSNGETIRLLVLPMPAHAGTLVVSHNQLLTGKNAEPRYRLALVLGPQLPGGSTEIRYVDQPFAKTEMQDYEAVYQYFDARAAWEGAKSPF